MRLCMIFVVLALLIPKVVLAIKDGTPVDFTQGELVMLGIVFGAKAIQSHAENSG